MAERLFRSIQVQENPSPIPHPSFGILRIQLKHQLEDFGGRVPTPGLLQAESQVVMRLGVVRLRADDGEVTERRVLEETQLKLDLAANGGVVNAQFAAAAGQHVQSFGKLSRPRAPRHNVFDMPHPISARFPLPSSQRAYDFRDGKVSSHRLDYLCSR